MNSIAPTPLWKRAGRVILGGPLYTGVRYGMALVFLYAGIMKLANPRSFAVIIGDYGLIPDELAMPVAVVLPLLEAVAAIGLAREIRGSLSLIAALLLLFIGLLGYGMWMGLDIDCGCFGPGDPEADAYAGLSAAWRRDWILFAGVLYLYFWRYKNSSSWKAGENSLYRKSYREDA